MYRIDPPYGSNFGASLIPAHISAALKISTASKCGLKLREETLYTLSRYERWKKCLIVGKRKTNKNESAVIQNI